MEAVLGVVVAGAIVYWMLRGVAVRDKPKRVSVRPLRDARLPEVTPAVPRFVDPVCGMKVPIKQGYTEHLHGMAYHFCSRDCRDRFIARPQHYLSSGTLPLNGSDEARP